MKTRKRQSAGLKPDSQGRYRSYIGQYVAEDGRLQPKRFWFGTDKAPAEGRYHRVHSLWSEVLATGATTWSPETLAFATSLANGSTPLYVETPPKNEQERFEANLTEKLFRPKGNWGVEPDTLKAAEYAQKFVTTKKNFPSIDLQAEPSLLAPSVQANQNLVAARIQQLKAELSHLGALEAAGSPSLDKLTGTTLDKALDLFCEALKADPDNNGPEGTLTQWGKNKTDMVATLQFFFAKWKDSDVGTLGKPECELLIKTLANRPTSRKGKALSKAAARHHIWLTRTFLKWLDGSPSIPWDMPAKLDLGARVRYRDPDIKEASQILEEVVTIPVEELKFMVSRATEIEKLYIGLALNCAYGADQLGRLQIEWIQENQIKGIRLKKVSASRHYLWACNVSRLLDVIGDRTQGTIFTGPDGRDLYRTSEAGNSIDGISRAWEQRLIPRCRKERKELPKYSFGKVRKTSATLTLSIADPSIASMLLAHKTISEDELLQNYARLPWEKLYAAQRQLEKELVGQLGL